MYVFIYMEGSMAERGRHEDLSSNLAPKWPQHADLEQAESKEPGASFRSPTLAAENQDLAQE